MHKLLEDRIRDITRIICSLINKELISHNQSKASFGDTQLKEATLKVAERVACFALVAFEDGDTEELKGKLFEAINERASFYGDNKKKKLASDAKKIKKG